MSELLEITADYLARRSLAVFCGAGISIRSGMPDAWSLVKELLTLLDIKERAVQRILASSIPLEKILYKANCEYNIEEMLHVFEGGLPNRNHALLAFLAKQRAIDTVCTTNFDLLLEQAMDSLGTSYRAYSDEKSFTNVDWSNNVLRLIKLHGTVNDKSGMFVTLDKIASNRKSLGCTTVIENMFSNGTHEAVLILGYSCSDELDISPQIRRVQGSKKIVLVLEHEVDGKWRSEDIKKKNRKNPFADYPGWRFYGDTDQFIKDLCLLYSVPLVPAAGSSSKSTDRWKEAVHRWGKALTIEARHYLAGALLYDAGQWDEALQHYNKAIEINTSCGDSKRRADCQLQIAEVHIIQGNFAEAVRQYDVCLSEYSKIDFYLGMAKSLRGLGNCYLSMQSFEKSFGYFERAAVQFAKIGDMGRVASCWGGQGNSLVFLARERDAIDRFTLALPLLEEEGDVMESLGCRVGLGNAYFQLREFDAAGRLYEEGIVTAQYLGDSWGEATCCLSLGNVRNELNKPLEALEILERGTQLYVPLDDIIGQARCNFVRGNSYAMLGDKVKALECFCRAQAVFKQYNLKCDFDRVTRSIQKLS